MPSMCWVLGSIPSTVQTKEMLSPIVTTNLIGLSGTAESLELRSRVYGKWFVLLRTRFLIFFRDLLILVRALIKAIAFLLH